MTDHDPFGAPDPNRTIIVPTPGRRAELPPRARPQPNEPTLIGAAPSVTGLNPLVGSANGLLDLVPQMRQTAQHADPQGLRDQLVRAVRDFRARATAAGVASEHVHAASYVLCTVLDEAVTSTPWGGSGVWAKESLLVTEHREAWGGEKVFQLLAKLAENPGPNRPLLELIYVCLSLGFEGRYRVLQNGRAQLDQVRERLWQMLRRDGERDLSVQWRGVTDKRNPVLAMMPIWVVAAVCGAVLLGTYIVLSTLLGRHAQPVHAEILRLHARTVLEPKPVPTNVAPAPPPPARLATFLAPEIREQLVAVRDEANQSIVTIRGDGLFAPGSATINPRYAALMARIAAALAAAAGQVVVSGHTDNRPIMSARFPSNWDLSRERARSVVELLTAGGTQPARLSAVGRGESEPIAANDTPENRSRNRRVEITLIVPPPDAEARK